MPDVREKLVELLGNLFCGDYGVNGCDSCKYNTEVMCNAYACADHLIRGGVTIQRWIPVTERLPDWRDGKVLVFTKYGFSICERTVNGRWKGQHANWINHWMPLPEPPKEVD